MAVWLQGMCYTSKGLGNLAAWGGPWCFLTLPSVTMEHKLQGGELRELECTQPLRDPRPEALVILGPHHLEPVTGGRGVMIVGVVQQCYSWLRLIPYWPKPLPQPR